MQNVLLIRISQLFVIKISDIMATLLSPTTEDMPSGDPSQSAALELLKPDPEPVEEQNQAEEDELEALRRAALMSIRPKKSNYKVQAHPVRQNLLSIVPVEDEPVVKKSPVKNLRENQARDSPSKSNKFSRYDDSDKSSELSSSEEEIEVEEEVTATEVRICLYYAVWKCKNFPATQCGKV